MSAVLGVLYGLRHWRRTREADASNPHHASEKMDGCQGLTWGLTPQVWAALVEPLHVVVAPAVSAARAQL